MLLMFTGTQRTHRSEVKCKRSVLAQMQRHKRKPLCNSDSEADNCQTEGKHEKCDSKVQISDTLEMPFIGVEFIWPVLSDST